MAGGLFLGRGGYVPPQWYCKMYKLYTLVSADTLSYILTVMLMSSVGVWMCLTYSENLLEPENPDLLNNPD